MSTVPFISETRLFSPPNVILRFGLLRAKRGDHAVASDVVYKRAREAFAAALFAIAASKKYGIEFWIQSPTADPPDAYLVELRPCKSKGTHRINTPLDIMEWESHSRHNDLADAIEDKLKGKRYPPQTILLVVMNRRDRPFDRIDISERFKTNPPKVAAIWILGSKTDALWPFHAAVRVFPGSITVRYDLALECRRLAYQREVIIPRRGFRKDPELVGVDEIEVP